MGTEETDRIRHDVPDGHCGCSGTWLATGQIRPTKFLGYRKLNRKRRPEAGLRVSAGFAAFPDCGSDAPRHALIVGCLSGTDFPMSGA